jgi:hypothetical protein
MLANISLLLFLKLCRRGGAVARVLLVVGVMVMAISSAVGEVGSGWARVADEDGPLRPFMGSGGCPTCAG